MSEKIDGRTKEGRALKAKQGRRGPPAKIHESINKVLGEMALVKRGVVTKKRLTRAQKPPFRLMIGRVNAAGSRFVFDKAVDFRTSNEMMAAAQKTIDKNDDSLRELIVSINPKEAK